MNRRRVSRDHTAVGPMTPTEVFPLAGWIWFAVVALIVGLLIVWAAGDEPVDCRTDTPGVVA